MRKKHKILISAVGAGLITAAIVLSTQHDGRRMGPSDIYPDPSSATGVVNPNVTQDNIGQTICVSGWTATIRPTSQYTTALKISQMAELKLPGVTSDYEEDHLISLELGGSPTDPNNLWPEKYSASIPDGGAKTKDSVENFLKKEVCSNQITLAQAQSEIILDWYAVWKKQVEPQHNSLLGGENSYNLVDPDDETGETPTNMDIIY